MTVNLAQLIGQIEPTAGLRLRQAYVSAVTTGPPACTIRLGGNATAGDDIPGVRYLRGTHPAAGDTVWVLQTDGTLLIVGVVDAGAWPPAARAYHNASQSIPDNAETTVALNSERFDTTGMHDLVTLNSRITFAVAGLYVVTFTGIFDAAVDYNLAYASLRLGGTTAIATATSLPRTFSVNPLVNVTTVYKFGAGEFVTAVVYQDNTANAARNLLAVGNYSPELTAAWIGLG